jgi:hypothetical protein
MIVSVEDVRHIADAEDLATRSEVDTHKPPPADASAPETCRPVGHNDLTFGSGLVRVSQCGLSRRDRQHRTTWKLDG